MRMLRLAAFVGVLFAYQLGESSPLLARADTCAQACTATADCNEECGSSRYARIDNVNRAIGILQSLLQDSQFDSGAIYYLLGMAVTYLNDLTSTPCLLYQ